MRTVPGIPPITPAAHYERWPFPGVDHRSPEGLIFLRWLLACFREPPGPQGRRLLDAGCGTGHTLLALARHLPEVELVGFDASAASIERAIGLARHLGLERVRFLRADFQRTLPALGRFDVVLCLGVLHHVPALAPAFRRAADLVAPGGRLVLWLYGRHGRAGHVLNQRLLRLLERPGDADEDRFLLATSFLESAGDRLVHGSGVYTPCGDGPEGLQWLLHHPEWMADQMFPAWEAPVTLDEILELFDAHGLAFERWFGVRESAEAWLTAGPLRDRLRDLPRRDRLRAIECLLRPSYYFVSARRKAEEP